MQENCALNQMEKKMVYQRFEELTTIRFNTSVLLLMIINLHLENLDVFVCHLYAFARMNVRCIKGEKEKNFQQREYQKHMDVQNPFTYRKPLFWLYFFYS